MNGIYLAGVTDEHSDNLSVAGSDMGVRRGKNLEIDPTCLKLFVPRTLHRTTRCSHHGEESRPKWMRFCFEL